MKSEEEVNQGAGFWPIKGGVTLKLLTLEEFAQLPDGTTLTKIDGRKFTKGKDPLSFQTRMGYLSFGVPIEEMEPPLTPANLEYILVHEMIEVLIRFLMTCKEREQFDRDNIPNGTICMETYDTIIERLKSIDYELWECLSGQMEGA